MKKIFFIIVSSVLAAAAVSSCGPKGTEYETWPEEVYVGQLTEVVLLPGYERFLITGSTKYMTTAHILRVELYGTDTYFDVPVDRTQEEFTYEVNGLSSGNYYVILTSIDKDGNKSVPQTYNVDVYDEQSKSMFYPKRIISGEYDSEEGTMTLLWNAIEEAVSVVMVYKDSESVEHRDTLSGTVQKTVLDDWLDLSQVEVYTTILPVNNCVDTFEMDKTLFTFPRKEDTPDEVINLPRSTFKMITVASDVLQGQYGGPTSLLWDGKLAYYRDGYHSNDGQGVPHHITFDLGVKAKLSGLNLYYRQDGALTDWPPRRFQIWGHPDITEEGKTISDYDVYDSPTKDNDEFISESTAAGWILLTEYYPTEEEIMTNFMSTVTLDDTQSVRYFRYRIVEGWKSPYTGPTMYGNATEIELKAWKKSIKQVAE